MHIAHMRPWAFIIASLHPGDHLCKILGVEPKPNPRPAQNPYQEGNALIYVPHLGSCSLAYGTMAAVPMELRVWILQKLHFWMEMVPKEVTSGNKKSSFFLSKKVSAVLLSYKVLKIKKIHEQKACFVFVSRKGRLSKYTFSRYLWKAWSSSRNIFNINIQSNFHSSKLAAFIMRHVFDFLKINFRHQSRKDRNVARSLYLFNDA